MTIRAQILNVHDGSSVELRFIRETISQGNAEIERHFPVSRKSAHIANPNNLGQELPVEALSFGRDLKASHGRVLFSFAQARERSSSRLLGSEPQQGSREQ
jgi:hypothetical protein